MNGRFLTILDYRPMIKDEILKIITREIESNRTQPEDAAQDLITSYIKERYDAEKIFVPVYNYSETQTYAAGELVYYQEVNENLEVVSEKIYSAKMAVTGEPPTDTDYWEAKDTRNKLMVEKMVDLVLYTIHGSVAPSKISEIRIKRFDDAITWLNRIAARKISPNLPLIEQPIDEVRWGSNPKLGHSY